MRLHRGARLAVAAAVALALPLAGAAGTAARARHGQRELTLQTQKRNLGSSRNPAQAAPTPEPFGAAVAQIYETMVFTDFPTRAGAIADMVAAQQPAIIGLQEVSTWTAVGLVPGATPRSFDFLEILFVGC